MAVDDPLLPFRLGRCCGGRIPRMRERCRLPALLSFPLVAILAVYAAGGIVLPAFIVGGVALVRRRPRRYWLAPTLRGSTRW